MKPFALCSTRVCTAAGVRPAAITIRDGRIESISDRGSVDRQLELYDLQAKVISPGIIDTHLHINEPGTDWEGFESATKAAAAGGVTTIVDMPLNSIPVTTTKAALEQKRRVAIGNCHVDVGFYAGLVPGNSDQIPGLIDAGVLGVKAFLCPSGLNEFPNVDEHHFRVVLPILKAAGLPLLVHAELVEPDAAIPVSNQRSYAQYLASRPDAWELGAIELLIVLCREFDARIHIVHLATGTALSQIAAAKRDGLRLSVETCPHYLYFSAEQIQDGATRFKCAPPIRSKQNQIALRDALGMGLIDTIGSDHSPCPTDLKHLEEGNFSLAWGGIAGLQLTLPTVWTVGQQQGWQPEQLANWLSAAPAKLVGLEHRKGILAAGYDADIVVWDPDSSFQIDAGKLFHRHPCTPYHGEQLQGIVEQTYLRGQLVYDNGQHADQPLGHLIHRQTPRRVTF